MRQLLALVVLLAAGIPGLAVAELLTLKAAMSPKERIYADLPSLLDNGVWCFIGGTGGLAGVKGAGTMHIKAVSATEREFSFDGEFTPGTT